MPVDDVLAWPAPRFADAPFLVDEGRVLTHAEAAGHVAATARNVAAAARVMILAEPTIECVLSVIACWSRGALAVIIDGREPAASRGAIADACEASLIAVGPAREAAESPGIELALTPIAVALRTSGSTGTPKLAVHRLASLIANARAANARTAFGPGDRWLLSLSPHHIGGLSIIVRAMVGGGAVRLGRGPSAVAEDLSADRAITHCSVVGTQLRRVLDGQIAVTRCRGLKAMLLGGGPAPASWRREAVCRGIRLCSTYGLTECASQVATGIATEDDLADDAGTPLDGVLVRFADDGEILVGGTTVFAGYLERDGVRDARRGDGLFATGDIGRFDERGHLHVLGRKDAMFVSGGENIRPEEIERVLREVPGITQACVVAVEEERWQKRPVAFVAGAFDLHALERTLAAQLPRFKWPVRVYPMPHEQSMRTKPDRTRLATLAASSELAPLWTRGPKA